MVELTLTEKGDAMAQHVMSAEAELHTLLMRAAEGHNISDCLVLLRRIVEERPAGEALARRMQKR
jgi:hypothetical protein